MKIHAGYEISYACSQPTPMILMLSVHPSRSADLITPDRMQSQPPLASNSYLDGFGNVCHVIHAPAGKTTISSDFLVKDNGAPDDIAPNAGQHALDKLPVETLVYLLGSRYCETDQFVNIAWAQFGNIAKGWPLVQAICDFVHDHVKFGYEHASPTKTAWQAYAEGRGVCRDFAHLAITLCRCMNIPARYCTGYLGDVGVPPDPAPMDFSAWFEVYLGDRWYTFDARHNAPRIGRILMARGRDATDVAISTSFGPCGLLGFKVVTNEVPMQHAPANTYSTPPETPHINQNPGRPPDLVCCLRFSPYRIEFFDNGAVHSRGPKPGPVLI
jgi:transglutaminase-like putative cysteine protease